MIFEPIKDNSEFFDLKFDIKSDSLWGLLCTRKINFKLKHLFWFLYQACSYLYIYSYKDNLWFKARELIYAWKI